MRALSIRLLPTLLLIAFFGGCAVYKTIVVKPGDPMQLLEDVPNVKVGVNDDLGVRREARATLPAGAWVITDDGRELPPLESGTNTKKEGEK